MGETYLVTAESHRKAADIFASHFLQAEYEMYGFEFAKKLAQSRIVVIGRGSSEIYECAPARLLLISAVKKVAP